MLFNSYVFILAFLPVALILYHALHRYANARAAIASLVLMSLAFYGWWSPKYLPLLLVLMAVNFTIAQQIARRRLLQPKLARLLFITGITINLGALGYYKYANFFVDNVNQLFGFDLVLATIILPIGISFFVFQKIAFLVDVHRGKVTSFNWLDFALFVMFFPQLIAGPIVHHSEVMPQFADPKPFKPNYFALGLTLFIIGLSKKVLLADTAATYASPQFDAVAAGAVLSLQSAWSAALAYTAQLYFDFSAYSDMAVGLGLLFGIRLPINFNSPYKSISIIEFWHRWHITLSRFLRDYLYIPLGGNRHGKVRRYINLFVTMALGGLWHGAGWTFLIWGMLHGSYLMINHAWRGMMEKFGQTQTSPGVRLIYAALTFLAVVVAWVFFRAANVETALSILASMAGMQDSATTIGPVDADMALLTASGLLLLAWLAPNSYQLTGYVGPEGSYGNGQIVQPARFGNWRMSTGWAVLAGLLLALDLSNLSKVSEFIYFQF